LCCWNIEIPASPICVFSEGLGSTSQFYLKYLGQDRFCLLIALFL